MYNPVISCFFFLVYNCMSRLSFFLLLPPTKLWENFKLAFSCLPSPFSYTSVARDIRQNVSLRPRKHSHKPAHRSPPPTEQHEHDGLTFFCTIRFFTVKIVPSTLCCCRHLSICNQSLFLRVLWREKSSQIFYG